MKKYILAFTLLVLSLVAMDDTEIKKQVEHMLEQEGFDLDKIEVITSSHNVPPQLFEEKETLKKKIEKNLNQMRIVYKTFFEDIKERDVKASAKPLFQLRFPSYYINKFLQRWNVTFSETPSLKNTIFFTKKDYQQLDQKFANLYVEHYKNLSRVWTHFIKYFMEIMIESNTVMEYFK